METTGRPPEVRGFIRFAGLSTTADLRYIEACQECTLGGQATAMEIEGSFVCPYCFQVSTILIDVSAGRRQQYIEDCQVCCRPALLAIVVDAEHLEAEVTASTP